MKPRLRYEVTLRVWLGDDCGGELRRVALFDSKGKDWATICLDTQNDCTNLQELLDAYTQAAEDRAHVQAAEARDLGLTPSAGA